MNAKKHFRFKEELLLLLNTQRLTTLSARMKSSIDNAFFFQKEEKKQYQHLPNIQERGYHWAIYAPAAFLRTKSGLSLYGAPSMGSETTPPYAWLLWRFKKTLANPVTWCCRCLYDMLARKLQVCSATISKRLLSAFLLSIMRLLYGLKNKHIHTNKSKWEEKKKRRREEWKWNEISYVLAKLSLSYPVKINSARNTPRLFFFQWLLCRLRRRRRSKKKKKNEKKQHKEKNKSKQMPSQDKWDCIKQLSAVAQVNVKRMERKVKCNNNNQLNWEHLFKPSG